MIHIFNASGTYSGNYASLGIKKFMVQSRLGNILKAGTPITIKSEDQSITMTGIIIYYDNESTGKDAFVSVDIETSNGDLSYYSQNWTIIVNDSLADPEVGALIEAGYGKPIESAYVDGVTGIPYSSQTDSEEQPAKYVPRYIENPYGDESGDESGDEEENPYIAPPENPYIAPTENPYIAPTENPYIAPPENPYIAPPENPYIAPVKPPENPYIAPVKPPENPYIAPTENPYIAPVKPPENPYIAPTENPYITPVKPPENPYIAPVKPPENPYITPVKPPENPYTAPPEVVPSAVPYQGGQNVTPPPEVLIETEKPFYVVYMIPIIVLIIALIIGIVLYFVFKNKNSQASVNNIIAAFGKIW